MATANPRQALASRRIVLSPPSRGKATMKKEARAPQKPSLYSRMLGRLNRKYHQYSNSPITCPYGDFSIELPPTHQLQDYQHKHPKYDKFLPFLARYIDPPGTIVDVGANVGDTLAGMVQQNPSVSYVCIEPDDFFYPYLERNARTIAASVSGLQIQTIKALVGQNISNVSLDGKRGTRHAVMNGMGDIASAPLHELVASTKSSRIRILKSDVDGFDYDVLDSSMPVIEAHGPMLFFECHYDHEYQKDGYARTIRSLEAAGYRDWTLFDNFGELMVRTDNAGVVIQLMDYVWQQNTGQTTRTIYYYDILAVQQKDSALIGQVLAEYR
jgi:FkbM family methyltransferase